MRMLLTTCNLAVKNENRSDKVGTSELVFEASEFDADRIGAMEECDEVVGGLLAPVAAGLHDSQRSIYFLNSTQHSSFTLTNNNFNFNNPNLLINYNKYK